MIIRVTSGTGTGPTELAAFDAALLDAGVANYNLIPLSHSWIPSIARPWIFGNELNSNHIFDVDSCRKNYIRAFFWITMTPSCVRLKGESRKIGR
jgi:hypothetical protein